jgi:hypothetical protein
MKEYHAQNCATAEAVNYRPLTLEARDHPGQFLLNLWRIKEQWDRFLSKYCSFVITIIPPIPYIHSFICYWCYIILAVGSVIK